jgi:hypothetical protein
VQAHHHQNDEPVPELFRDLKIHLGQASDDKENKANKRYKDALEEIKEAE